MRKIEIYGNAEQSSPIELFKREIIASSNSNQRRQLLDVSDVLNRPKTLVDVSWLPLCSEKYNISPNIRDYILCPAPVVTGGIPNINMNCFSVKDLFEFVPGIGMPRYRTFIGKPTFVNHENSDYTQAKGVNIDVVASLIPKYGIVKTWVLSLFDRSKDPYLAKHLLMGSPSFSMGARSPYFECSICGGILGPGIERTCTCSIPSEPIDWENMGGLMSQYGKVYNGRLHYLLAKEFEFFENSFVENPADITAVGTLI